jgi:hypothetical protein
MSADQITSDQINTKVTSNKQQDDNCAQVRAAAARIKGHAAGALGLGATAKWALLRTIKLTGDRVTAHPEFDRAQMSPAKFYSL